MTQVTIIVMRNHVNGTVAATVTGHLRTGW